MLGLSGFDLAKKIVDRRGDAITVVRATKHGVL